MGTSKSAIVDRAAALRQKMMQGDENSKFLAKVAASSSVNCELYEFNIWHAASDNVVTNGGDLPWGTLGSVKSAK